jgi:hypothetical protein
MLRYNFFNKFTFDKMFRGQVSFRIVIGWQDDKKAAFQTYY